MVDIVILVGPKILVNDKIFDTSSERRVRRSKYTTSYENRPNRSFRNKFQSFKFFCKFLMTCVVRCLLFTSYWTPFWIRWFQELKKCIFCYSLRMTLGCTSTTTTKMRALPRSAMTSMLEELSLKIFLQSLRMMIRFRQT